MWNLIKSYIQMTILKYIVRYPIGVRYMICRFNFKISIMEQGRELKSKVWNEYYSKYWTDLNNKRIWMWSVEFDVSLFPRFSASDKMPSSISSCSLRPEFKLCRSPLFLSSIKLEPIKRLGQRDRLTTTIEIPHPAIKLDGYISKDN